MMVYFSADSKFNDLGNSISIILLATCLMVQETTAVQTTYKNETNANIILGGLFPVHTSNSDGSCGAIQDYGYQRAQAMVLAVNIVNDDPLLLPGLRLGFDIRDTCSRPTNALQASLAFIVGSEGNSTALPSFHPGISGVVGSASSTESIQAASLLRLFQTPQVSYASTAVILSDKTRYQYFLRTLPPDVFQARVMVDLIVHFNWTYVIAMNSDDDYGHNGIDAFVELLNLHNQNQSYDRSFCVADDPISIPRHAEDSLFDDIIRTINQPWFSNSSVIVLFGQPDTIEGLLRAINRTNNHRPMTFIVSDGAGDNLDLEYYPLAHGMLSIVPEYNISTEFDEYFTSLKPSNNEDNPWLEEYWESLFKCSFTTSPPYCNETMQSISSANYHQNSKVPFVMDAVFAFAHAIHDVLLTDCGKVTVCDEVLRERYGRKVILGNTMLRHLINNVSFNGVSAMIDFDDNGDQNGGYVINNLQKVSSSSYRFVKVAKWNPTTNIEKLNYFSSIQFNNSSTSPPISLCSHSCSNGHYPVNVELQSDCCWECEPCRSNREVSDGTECIVCEEGYSPDETVSSCKVNPLSYLEWKNPASVLIVLASIIGMVLTVTITLVFMRFRKENVVKASSRELSGIILIGLFLCFTIPFVSIGEPHPVTCGISRFLFGFSFSLCYSALLVKTIRIHRIFNNKINVSQRPSFISPWMQLLATGMFVSVQVFVTLSWLLLERPGTSVKYNDGVTEVRCNHTPYFGALVSLGYNIFLLLVTTYFGFRTRSIPQNFNETKFINLTLYTVIIIWLAFIPTYIAINTIDLNIEFLTGSELFAIVLSGITTLCALFFPKLYFIFSKKQIERNMTTYEGGPGNPNIFNERKSSTIFSSQIGKPDNDGLKFANMHRAISVGKDLSSTELHQSIDATPPPLSPLNAPTPKFKVRTKPIAEERCEKTISFTYPEAGDDNSRKRSFSEVRRNGVEIMSTGAKVYNKERVNVTSSTAKGVYNDKRSNSEDWVNKTKGGKEVSKVKESYSVDWVIGRGERVNKHKQCSSQEARNGRESKANKHKPSDIEDCRVDTSEYCGSRRVYTTKGGDKDSSEERVNMSNEHRSGGHRGSEKGLKRERILQALESEEDETASEVTMVNLYDV